MNAGCVSGTRDFQNPVDLKIALARGRRTDQVRFITDQRMQRTGVSFRIDGNRPHTEPPGGTRDPDSDFAAIGNENRCKHTPGTYTAIARCASGGAITVRVAQAADWPALAPDHLYRQAPGAPVAIQPVRYCEQPAHAPQAVALRLVARCLPANSARHAASAQRRQVVSAATTNWSSPYS
jgi:hypothetical protein